MNRAYLTQAVCLLYAEAALACSVEFNEIAYLIPNKSNVITGEVIAAEFVTYVSPYDENDSLRVTESAVIRVSEVLEGPIESETIRLDLSPGPPDWNSTCGPYTYSFYGYEVGEHYLLMLGQPQEDGSFRGGGWLRQTVIRLPSSDDVGTGLTEYVRHAALTDERPIQLDFRGPSPTVIGERVDVEIEVTNRLPYTLTVATGPGPRPELGGSPGMLRLTLGPEPDLRKDRPPEPVMVQVAANSTSTFTVPLGDYYEFTEGRYGLSGAMRLAMTSEPGGQEYRDGWGNFGAVYRFELTQIETAVPLMSWGRTKTLR